MGAVPPRRLNEHGGKMKIASCYSNISREYHAYRPRNSQVKCKNNCRELDELEDVESDHLKFRAPDLIVV